jgi:chorismate synthase
MSFNTFGHMFRHDFRRKPRGRARLRGRWLPAANPADGEEIQQISTVAARASKYTTGGEADQVKILSGVMDTDKGQVTTGTPIALMIENTDQRSKDYSEIKDKFRPGRRHL